MTCQDNTLVHKVPDIIMNNMETRYLMARTWCSHANVYKLLKFFLGVSVIVHTVEKHCADTK
jgi:hypothetical protein